MGIVWVDATYVSICEPITHGRSLRNRRATYFNSESRILRSRTVCGSPFFGRTRRSCSYVVSIRYASFEGAGSPVVERSTLFDQVSMSRDRTHF